MAEKTDAQLATEAAQRANAAANEPRDPRTVRSSIKAAAAAARAAIPAGAGKLNEPAIADAGTGVAVPRTGAAPDSGGAGTPAPAPGTQEQPVLLVDDDEFDELQQQAEGGEQPAGEGETATAVAEEGEGAAPAEGEGEAGAEGEGTAEGEGEAEGEWITVELPGRRPGDAPTVVDVEDPELAAEIARLNRMGIRREQLAIAMEDVNRAREEMAQLEDALTVDPANYLVNHVRRDVQVETTLALLAQPGVYDAVNQRLAGLEGDELRHALLQTENDRLSRQSRSTQELGERSRSRVFGREIDGALQQIVPDEMDARTSEQLYKDLRRDVAEYISTHGAQRLQVRDLPGILEWRLQQYGITPDFAAERLEDAGLPPLPVRARAARANGNGAPARTQRQPARTGESVVAQADRRRAAAAVPGGGAGVPAQGAWVVPKKGLGIKGMVNTLREIAGLGK